MKTILPPLIVNEINQYIIDYYEGYKNIGQVDDKPEIAVGIWHDTIEIHGCTIQLRLCSPNSVNDLPTIYWWMVSSKTLPTVEITTSGGCLVSVKSDCDMLIQYVDLDEEDDDKTSFHPEFTPKLNHE